VERSTWTSELHGVREGKQDRSRKTQAALLDAAEDLFATRGIAGATIADISAAAGCSIGAFYHHYRDKRAVQIALLERSIEEYQDLVRLFGDDGNWEDATIGDILLAFLEVFLAKHRSQPSRVGAAIELARGEPDFARQFAELGAVREARLRDLLLSRGASIGHEDPELATNFIIDQLGSMLRALMLEAGASSQSNQNSDDDFIRQAVRMACAYLQTELPAGI